MRSFWDRYARARVSRRRALQTGGCATLAVGVLTFVGCDRGGSSEDGDADITPRRGGTLRFGTTVPVAYGLDPHLEQGGALPVIARLYGYPFHVDSEHDDALILDHAIAVEQPAPDVYVVRMGGHRFHAAGPAANRSVTSHDMVFSMRRYRDHPLVVNRWWHQNMLSAEGGSDERTVVVRTRRPYVYSLAELGDINAGALVPQEATESQLELRTVDTGSGPMQLREALLPERVVLERYEAYARDSAYVDAMDFRTLESDEQMLTHFGNLELDVVTLDTHQQYVDLVDDKEVLGAREVATSWTSLGLRVDRPPFADVRVRRAIDLAIDRRELAGQVADGEALLAGPVAPGLGGDFWSLDQDELARLYETQRPVSDRRRESRELLEAAGALNAPVALQVSDDPALGDLASLVQAQLRMAGFEVSIERLPLLRWFVNYRRGEFTATLISHPPYPTPDGSMRLYHSAALGVEGNQFGFRDDAIDRLIERAWGEDDREARRETVLEAQRIMIDARPMVHLIAANGYGAAHDYVRDNGLALPGTLARYHYRQWLGLPVEGRPD